MNVVIENWHIIVVVIVLLVVGAVLIYRFLKQPRPEQLKKVREWLLYAVTAAEKELGSGTGKLKLRWVYDLFIVRFPSLATIVRFELFSALVDDALDEMREMLNNNKAVAELVEGGAVNA